MEAVFGIDAAWTERHPSGIALIVREGSRWRCVAVHASQEEFTAAAGHDPVPGLEASALLRASEELLDGGTVAAVACDMPLSLQPITGRRAADNETSRAFGRFRLGTHTPTQERPGPIADRLRASFEEEGFGLATTNCRPRPALLEVYPHTVLLDLLREKKRLPYKESRTGKYWPDLSPDERREKLRAVWTRIARALAEEIDDLPPFLLEPRFERPWKKLKRIEDALDAVICAWAGALYLDEKTVAYGDGDAALWTPPPPEF